MPKCTAPIIIQNTVVGEVCHIRARRKNGPRYDPVLTLAQRNAYDNLLLLCRTCHKIIDGDEMTYDVDFLTDIKSNQKSHGGLELNSSDQTAALKLIESLNKVSQSKASAKDGGIAVSIGGNNNGNVSINQIHSKKPTMSGYPANSIGADANLSGYIDYLFGLAVDYWSGVPTMNPGRLGKKIKDRFRLKLRTRNHLSVDRFHELSDFLIKNVLEPSPVGKRHSRNGTKLCRSFEEWRSSSS